MKKKIPFIFSDIDGVIMDGRSLISDVAKTLNLLRNPLSDLFPNLYKQSDYGNQKIPLVFITNAGGFTESLKAQLLNSALKNEKKNKFIFTEDSIVCNFSPLRNMLNEQQQDKLFLIIGSGKIHQMVKALNIEKYIRFEEYLSLYSDHFQHLLPYNEWFQELNQTKKIELIKILSKRTKIPVENFSTIMPADTILILNDEIHWLEATQTIIDHLTVRNGKFHFNEAHISKPQVPIFSLCVSETTSKNIIPLPKLTFGAYFTNLNDICLEYFNDVPNIQLLGKPYPETFSYAYYLAQKQAENFDSSQCYMIGDNLQFDIAGAKNFGWKTVWIEQKKLGLNSESLRNVDYIALNFREAVEFILSDINKNLQVIQLYELQAL